MASPKAVSYERRRPVVHSERWKARPFCINAYRIVCAPKIKFNNILDQFIEKLARKMFKWLETYLGMYMFNFTIHYQYFGIALLCKLKVVWQGDIIFFVYSISYFMCNYCNKFCKRRVWNLLGGGVSKWPIEVWSLGALQWVNTALAMHIANMQ